MNAPSFKPTPFTYQPYQPKLLLASAAPHAHQRYPAGDYRTIRGTDTATSSRTIEVMRFADQRHAKVSVDDIGATITIRLGAAALRALAHQLLDAAHDIEHVPAVLEQAA